jgi:putative ABC transport system ATP-binding protein
MDLLVDCARDQDASVVLVTHEARVAAYADREVVVRDGPGPDARRQASAPGRPT